MILKKFKAFRFSRLMPPLLSLVFFAGLSLASVYGFEPPRPHAAALLPVIVIFSLYGGLATGLLSTLLAGLYLLLPLNPPRFLPDAPQLITGLAVLLFNGVLLSFAGQKFKAAPSRLKNRPSVENILDMFPSGMAIVSLEGRFLQGNRALLTLLGLKSHELLELSLDDVAQPENGATVRNHLHNLLNGAADIRYEGCCLHKAGFPVWLRVLLSLERDDFGAPHYLLAHVDDISLPTMDNGRLNRPAAEITDCPQTPSAVLDHIPALLACWNKDLINTLASRAYEEWRGLPPGQTRGRHMREVLGEERYLTNKTFIDEALRGKPQAFEQAETDFSGLECFKQIDYLPNHTETGVQGFYELIADAAGAGKNQDFNWRRDSYDQLTRLPNRRLFMDRLGNGILRAERNGTFIALLYIDLDRFTEVNDSLGQPAGDAMLIEVAKRLASCLRASDTLSRPDGDEFMAILADLDDYNHVEPIAEKLLSILREPLEAANELFFISGSIGVALYPHDAKTAATLVKHADQAMHASKLAGRNRFSYYTRFMQDEAWARLKLASDLRVALDENQFALLFQPVVDSRTGGIHKAEALLRWRHPSRGVVSPAEFIPLAEKTGLIPRIGDWVFREAANFAKHISIVTGKPFQVSVNKSAARLHEKQQAEDWCAYLREIGLNPKQMAVEIAEKILFGPEPNAGKLLLDYRDAGMEVAIDNFGVGNSSLAELRKFDIDYLKIDQFLYSPSATGLDGDVHFRSHHRHGAQIGP